MNDTTLETQSLKKDEFLFKRGDKTQNLYRVLEGKIMLFNVKGSRIDPIFICQPGKFLGYSLFFSNKKERNLFAVALEDSSVSVIPQDLLKKNFPKWLDSIAVSLCQKTESNLELILKSGIKKRGQTISPLSIEEQRYYLKLLKEDD